jgi:hypothetical protein
VRLLLRQGQRTERVRHEHSAAANQHARIANGTSTEMHIAKTGRGSSATRDANPPTQMWHKPRSARFKIELCTCPTHDKEAQSIEPSDLLRDYINACHRHVIDATEKRRATYSRVSMALYARGARMTSGVSETLGTELPAKFDRFFPWADIDRRSSVAREFAADLNELWSALGGVEQLSVQKRWLTERVTWMRRRMLQFETALMAQAAAADAGSEAPKLPMDAGTYSNFANVVMGHLKTLGIERQARRGPSLRDVMNGTVSPIKGASP